MKKMIAAVLLLTVIVSLSACGHVKAGAETETLLTRDEAISLALADAQLTEEDVYDLDAELDRERGTPVWEVDFDTRELEYSYDIHAETGEILRSDRERD